ncbi:MAG: hypothetical protein JWR26_4124 [Pedosphaera sp.]|nr:hypothetical protein [Pedosphaera sp.]
MNEQTTYDPAGLPRTTWFRRISWQAIFGGLIITLAVELVLSVLGISIGTTVANPFTNQSSAQGVGIAEGVWLILVTIISLFFGGWVAGRLAGLPKTTEGALHGLITWATATLLTVYLLTTTVGSLLGGGMRILAQVIPAAGQAVAASSNQQAGPQTSAQNPIQNMLTPTGRPDSQSSTPQSPQLKEALDRLFSHGGTINADDREAVVNALVAQGNMSRAEANQKVDAWIQNYQQTKAQAGQKARQVGQAAATGVSVAGWLSFAILVLSAIAAASGGARGARSFLRSRTETVAAA